MSKYNFDKIANRRNIDSIKYQGDKNILPMWVADMDYYVLPEIVEAIKEKADRSCFGYVDILDGYFESYIYWCQRKYHIDIPKEYFIFSLGVVASIDSIFKHLLSKGDKVMMFSPIYHTFYHCIDHNELEFVDHPLIYDEVNHSYSVDLDHLEENLKGVKALLLCNPHNPVGHIYSLEELNEIARICYENDVYLLSDEIHFDITSPDTLCHSILEVDKKYLDNVITLLAPSKAFNLASIQASAIVVPNEELKEKIQSYVYMDDVGEPNYFSCAATMAAYNYGLTWNIEMREYVEKNKEYLDEFLKSNLPNIHLVKSNSLYLCWVDISYYSVQSDEFAKELKEKTGLWVCPGTQFKGNGSGFLRVNVATSLENVQDACLRLQKFIKEYK